MEEITHKIINFLGKSSIVVALWIAIFSVIKVILSPELRDFKKGAAAIFVGFFTGWLISLVMIDIGYGVNLSAAAGCFFAIMSERIWQALMAMDYGKLLSKIFDALIGKIK